MAEFSEEVLKILNGEANENPVILDHRAATDSATFTPVTKHNICYIVACVLINENDEVLLIQESKRSCYGLWYLPAGRVDPEETLADAVRREVKEEAGVDIEPEALVLIELQYTNWFRFTFTGRIVGGTLKTSEDKESIQARWWPVKELEQTPKLRSFDMLCPVEKVRQYLHRENQLIKGINLTLKSHNQLIQRLLICTNEISKTNAIKLVTASEDNKKHLPSIQLGRNWSFHESITRLLVEIFEETASAEMPYHVVGIVSVEHDGSKTKIKDQFFWDGFCMTVMVSVADSVELKLKKKFSWYEIHKDSELFQKLEEKCTRDSPALCKVDILC